ncbi:MAG: glycerol acyltransferase [Lutibacter sp.]|nr:MAG: glycerol acyltransferase [Lutibacter sp.]
MLYTFLKYYVRLVLFFYHKKIKVVGKENIPKKGAVLFISNHPNALLDSLLVVTNNVRNMHFLARASAFKYKLVAKFLKSIKMIPVYRKRDGVNTLARNRTTFSKSVELMHEEKALFIAAEGSHNVQKRVRELKKGFVHIILDTFKKYPNVNIQIVPIGLNFDSVMNYPSSASVYYGKPINAKDYYHKDDAVTTTKALLKVVRDRMKILTIHIEDVESYDKTIVKLDALNVDYLDPIKTNEIIKNIADYTVDTEKTTVKKQKNLLYYLVVLNSLFPWMVWKKLEKGIKEKEFISTFRFAIGGTLFPFFYTMQSILINYFFGFKIALLYFIGSILIVLLLTKTSKI